MFHKHRVKQLSGKHSEMQRSMINNFLSFLEILRILEEERIRRPGYGTETLPPKLKSFVDIAMKDVFQPLKIGLSDLFQRTDDTETPVLRCLQKVNLQEYMGTLRDLKYSTLKSFSSLQDASLRAIVEQKLNLTEEGKIKFAKAVECLGEYMQSQEDSKDSQDSQETPSTSETSEGLEKPTQDEAPSTVETPKDETPLTAKEIDLKTQLDQEITKEHSLEDEIKKDETEIKQLTESKQELSDVSKDAVDKLQSEIDDLTRKISVMRQRNKRMSRSLNKRSKQWVSEFDFAKETILQQREQHKKQLEILERQKANKEQQMRLMKILVLELEKKQMIDRKRQELKIQEMNEQMQKITEEMKQIHRNETQKTLERVTNQNKQQLSHIQQQLQSLQTENASLRLQKMPSLSNAIPLTYTENKPRAKTRKKRHKKHKHKHKKTPKKTPKKNRKGLLSIFV